MATGERETTKSGLRPYSAKDVIAHADIERGQLTHWTDSGLITASIRNERGSGKHRVFSFRNIIEARLAGELSQYGIPTSDIRLALRELHWRDLMADALLRAPSDPPTTPWGPQQVARLDRAGAIHFGSRSGTAEGWGATVEEQAQTLALAERWEALKDPQRRTAEGTEFLLLSPWQDGVRLYFDIDPTWNLAASGVIVRLRWILSEIEHATADWWRPEDRVADLGHSRKKPGSGRT